MENKLGTKAPKKSRKLEGVDICIADGGWIVRKRYGWADGPCEDESPSVFSEEQGAECLAYIMEVAGIPGADEELTPEEKKVHAKK